MLYSLLQPLLFTLEPENAHALALRALEARLKVQGIAPPPAARATQVMGLSFANPVGLAAGFDKNGAHIDALGALGFGFVEVGAITPRPQPGNPRPRIFRLPQHQALINRMGFNNVGADAAQSNIRRRRYQGIVGINIGKNADTSQEQAVADYTHCLEALYDDGDFFTINVSSPNTKNLRDLQHGQDFADLLHAVVAARDALASARGRRAPLAVKISPDSDDALLDSLADQCAKGGIDAVIACNTTTARTDVAAHPHAGEAGGLSGAPLRARATEVIRRLRRQLPEHIAIIGVGGIMSADDMREKFDAGAALIQIYSGFIYNGPGFPAQLIKALQ